MKKLKDEQQSGIGIIDVRKQIENQNAIEYSALVERALQRRLLCKYALTCSSVYGDSCDRYPENCIAAKEIDKFLRFK